MEEKEAATRFDDEQIIEIEIERLRSFKDHPFKVANSARTAHPFQRNGAPFRFKLSKAQQVN